MATNVTSRGHGAASFQAPSSGLAAGKKVNTYRFDDFLKLFGLVTADFALKGTDLEGGRLIENLQTLKGLLTDVRFHLSCLDIPLIDRTDAPLDTFLVASGWGGYITGHALLLKFTKKENGNFRCDLFNTGDGTEFHDSLLENGLKAKISNSILIDDISPSKINSHLFAFLQKAKDESLKAAQFYDALFRYLEGNISTPIGKGLLDFRTPQRSGTCSWKCIMSFLRHHSQDYRSYRKLKHAIFAEIFKRLLENLDLFDSDIPIEKRAKYTPIIKQSLEKFARSIAKSLESGYITPDEKREYFDLISRITEKLFLAQKSYSAARITLSPDQFTQETQTLTAGIDKESYDDRIEQLTACSLEFDLSGKDAIIASMNRVSELLRAHPNSDPIWALVVIRKLPLPNDPLWQTFTQQEQDELTELFHAILKPFTGSTTHLDRMLTAHYHVLGIVNTFRLHSEDSIFEKKAPLDLFEFGCYRKLDSLTLSLDDIAYRKSVYASFEVSQVPREQKLFYFIKVGQQFDYSSALSSTLDHTPFERAIKAAHSKTGLRLLDFLNDLKTHLPKVDFGLFRLFLMTQKHAYERLGYGMALIPDQIEAEIFNRNEFRFNFHINPNDALPLNDDTGATIYTPNSLASYINSYRASEDVRLSNALGGADVTRSTISANLADLDWRLLNFYIESFPKVLDDKRDLSCLLSYCHSERIYKAFEDQPLFRSKFKKTILDFYNYCLSEKRNETALYFLFFLSRGDLVCQELKKERLLEKSEFDTICKDLEKRGLSRENLDFLTAIKALGLKFFSLDDFLVNELELLLKGSSIATNLEVGVHDEFSKKLKAVWTCDFISIKQKFEKKSHQILKTLSEEDLKSLIDRAFFYPFKESSAKWRYDENERVLTSTHCRLSYYGNLYYDTLPSQLKKLKLLASDLTFQDGHFFHEKEGIVFSLHQGCDIYKIVEGFRTKFRNLGYRERFEIDDLIKQHGPLKYDGEFLVSSGDVSYYFFETGHVSKQIKRSYHYQDVKTKVICGHECAPLRANEEVGSFFNSRIEKKFWIDREGNIYLEFPDLQKIYFLDQQNHLIDTSSDTTFLRPSCPMIFSGNTEYLLQSDRTSSFAIFSTGQKTHFVKISSTNECVIEKEEDKPAIALMFFRAQDYEKAYHYIERCQSIGMISPAVCEILSSIIEINYNHPDALTCKMLIASLLWQNHILYHYKLSTALKEKLPTLHYDYLSQIGKGRLKPLSKDQEQLLFIKSEPKIDLLLERKRFLIGERVEFLPRYRTIPLNPAPSNPFPLQHAFMQKHEIMTPHGRQTIDNAILKKRFDYRTRPYRLSIEDFIAIALDIRGEHHLDEIKALILSMKISAEHQEKQKAYLLENLLARKSHSRLQFNSDQFVFSNDVDLIFKDALEAQPLFSKVVAPNVESYTTAKRAQSSSFASKTRFRIKDALPLDLVIDQIDMSSIEGGKPSLLKKNSTLEVELEDLEEEILKIAAALPESEERELISLKRAGGADLPPTLNELIALFALGERQKYLDAMYLSSEGASILHQLIGNYLERKVLHSIILEAIKGTNEELPSFIEKLKAQRVYDPKLLPEYLVFEALEGIRIHQGQLTNLSCLKEDPNALIHMIMGSGKSRVITPIWALMQGKYRDKLGVIVVPKPLYPTGKETAKDSIYKAFGKFGHPFEFSRKSSLDVDQLTMLNENLKRWKKEKGFIYTTKESLLSFMLFYEELFFKLEKATTAQKETLEKQIALTSEILRFFKEDATALFDEVHSLLNIKEEVNFTLGHSEPLSLEEAEFTKKIVLELLKIKELGLSEDRQAELQDYDRIVKAPILEFLKKEFPDIDPRYFAEENIEKVKSHPKKNLIALGKELISGLLPFTLSKKVNEHFGLRADSNLAIPYAANNTPKADSEFGSPYETLLYTLFYYTNQPIRTGVIQQYLDVEIQKAKKEMIKVHLSIDETSAGKAFLDRFGISLTSASLLDKIERLVNHSPQMRIDFMMLSLVSSIKTYKHKLSSNSQDLYRMFFSCQGMSGTPWNHTTFPVELTPYLDEEVDQISEQIIQRLEDTSIHTYKASTDELRLEAILDRLSKGNFHALIDCGALIKGVSNETMAAKILEMGRFAGVVYYNDQDELLVLTKERAYPFDHCKIPPDQRFTFYDQRHTTGSDIKQAPEAKALVTFSETTLEYELYQSIWRMRKIGQGQSIEVITSIAHGCTTATQILAKAKEAQGKKILVDNFRAQKAEVKAIALQAMREALMTNPSLFPRFKQYLQTELPTEAWELFGEVNQEKDAKELLLEYKTHWKQILDSLKDVLDARAYQERIDQLDERPLPKTQPSKAIDAGAEVENELDQELDEERHVEQELELLQVANHNQNPDRVYTRLDWNEEDSIFDPKKDDSLKAKVMRLHQKIKQVLNKVLSFLRLSFRFKGTLQPFIFRKLFPENLALKLSDVLKKSLKSTADIFDENISISSNFLLPFQSKNLFDGIQKPLLHVAVILDEEQKAQTMIIDQTDLSYFEKKLKDDTGASSKRLCIYSPTLGVTSHGKKEITDEELVKNESFRKQLAQIKFFGGCSNFNQDESSYLEKWIEHNGAPIMWQLFNQLISRERAKKEDFKQSSLSEIFKKLLKP